MGLFGPSKGVVILLTQEQIEEMIETKHPSYRQSHEDIRVWAPVSAEVKYSSKVVLVKTKKFKYEFPAEKLKKVVIFDNVKEAYYFAGDLVESKKAPAKKKENKDSGEAANEISLSEFEAICKEKGIWPMTVGCFQIADMSGKGVDIESMNMNNGVASLTLNGVRFVNIDTKRVVGFLIKGKKIIMVIK